MVQYPVVRIHPWYKPLLDDFKLALAALFFSFLDLREFKPQQSKLNLLIKII